MSDQSRAWPPEMDAADRVRHVALTRTTPQNAGWIAEEADVSRDTAAKYLDRMADQGDLEVVETADGTCYKPDDVTQFLREVRTLAEEQSVDELTNELRAIGDEIDSWKAAYDVESLEELRRSIGGEDLSSSDRRERLETIEEWEYNIQVREALQLAISLQSSLTKLDADPRIGEIGTGTLPQEG
ncbi:DUF7342 family protein [Natronorubrum bangense]|uniref:ArsR family transcriptional regulator n=2 Tax=Natronorubrum bangense TaxID=61858 RepID=A0A4D6HSJ2_9EURY|nr:DUF4208 domain-containing protein [Natronorubrum bangense]QCC56919.1 hypothetical protein DV706_20495 [Natronorubrum bangense]